jgi:peptide/nickel transport system ATP-binding protein
MSDSSLQHPHDAPSAEADSVIEVKNLTVDFETDKGKIRAVDDISFTVTKGKTLGVVGESGCGKSVTAMSIMQLIPTPPGIYASGEIFFGGENLLGLPGGRMQSIRGNKISMIFQEPMTSLNPVFTVGDQIGEAMATHKRISKKEARAKTIEMLKLVGIPAPEERVDVFPHQLSGGMRQRVMIAMALSCEPDLLIADEPTTALDVTIQAQILALLRQLQERLQMSIVMITHDLGVVAETCDEVQVMYAGRIVEKATVHDLFANPRHPYTLGLLRSIPGWSALHDLKAPVGDDGRPRLNTIPGVVPNLLDLPNGCAFQDRCERVTPECRSSEPELIQIENHHDVRCHNWGMDESKEHEAHGAPNVVTDTDSGPQDQTAQSGYRA